MPRDAQVHSKSTSPVASLALGDEPAQGKWRTVLAWTPAESSTKDTHNVE